MAIRIEFDRLSNAPLPLRLILATRAGNQIRELPLNNIKFKGTMVNGSEISFQVYKGRCLDKDGNIDDGFWRQITDMKLAYCPEFNHWYELDVDINEADATIKSVVATSLGEAELGQTNLYEMEINTEDDIARDDYTPTVLYNPDNEDASLLHRMLKKAPHYRISHVDESVADIQRTFTFDGKSIYDCCQEVAKEIDCLFLFDCVKTSEKKIDRTVSVYDLENSCMSCGARGDFIDQCDKCGSTAIRKGYGSDTTVYISRENLAKEVTFATDKDKVKNCFRLEAGDDLMTAAVVACNPNGSRYLWYIPDETQADMSQALRTRIASYNTLYDDYQNTHVFEPGSSLVTQYNAIVDKYISFDENLQEIPAEITGFPALMTAYFNTIDMQLFLNSALMPNSEISTTTAADEAAKLTSAALSPVAVANLASCSEPTASSAVLGMAKCIVRQSYQVKVNSASYNSSTHNWTGNFTVTNYGDEEDTATSSTITILINGDLETNIRQKIDRAMWQDSDEVTDISELFKLDLTPFTNELKKYSLQRLISFREACQAALGILIQNGTAEETHELYNSLYVPYRQKAAAIENEILVRSQEIAIVSGVYDEKGGLIQDGMQSVIADERSRIQQALDFEAYLGTELWSEFASFRREDTFSNSNYISDGLNNAELFARAFEFISIAQKEIYKSALLQHSITANIGNLLSMTEFQPIVNYFEAGNWIRVRVDGIVYRLRLSEYEIDYNNKDLNVTFTDVREGHSSASDISSLLGAVRSMQTSYDSVARQAKDGKESSTRMKEWAAEGFSLTTKIVGGAENQEFIMDATGFTGRELIPETEAYSDEQIKIISNGVYITDDGWQTVRASIGKFTFFNPETQRYEQRFGVIADTVVAPIILSQNVGIYNESGDVKIDENGITIIADESNNQTVFRIQKRGAGGTLTDILSIDSSGNLILSTYAPKSETIKNVVVEYALGSSDSTAPTSGWSTSSPQWTEGMYVWQRTKKVDGNNNTTYSDPVCIQGAEGAPGTAGVGISTVTEYFAVSASGTTAPADGDFSTTVPQMTTAAPYLWNYEVITKTDNTTQSTPKRVIGTKGQDGSSGRGISSVTEYYAVSTSNSQAPADSSFSTTVPTMDATNRYLWNYEVITYTDTTTARTDKRVIGTYSSDGQNGLNTAIVYLYKRSASAATIDWATELTYNFTNKALTSTPSGWSQTVPSGTNPIYVTAATASSRTNTDGIAANEWSTPVVLAQNGTDGSPGGQGDPGINSATVFLYQRAASSSGLTKPSSTLTYTFSTGALTPSSGLGSWSQTIPATDGNPCFVIQATAANSAATDTIASSEWSSITKLIADGEDGDDGVSITGVVNHYLATSASSGVTRSTSGWTTTVQTIDATNKYLWNYETISYSNSTSTNTDPTIIGTYGRDGTNGVGISSVVEYYAKNNSSSSAPADNAFGTTLQVPDASNKYLWNRELITYTDTSTAWTSKHIIGMYSADGAAGKGISAITNYYLASSQSSGVTRSTTGWTTAVQTTDSSKPYLWNYEEITYTSGDPSYSDPVIIGMYSTNGQDGLNTAIVYLYKRSASAATVDWATELTYNFTNKALTSTPSGWSQTVPSGTNPIYVTAATASSRTNTDGIAANEWSTPVVLAQNGIDGSPGGQGDPGINSATVFLYQRAASASGLTKPSSTLTYTFSTGVLTPSSGLGSWSQTIPATNGNPCFVIQATAANSSSTDTIASSEWSSITKLIMDGEDGDDGVSITSVVSHYLATSASSGVTRATTGWTTTIQQVTATNKYLWNYETISYSNSTTTETDPIIIGTYGDKGDQGDPGTNTAVVQLYKRVSDEATASGAIASFSNGAAGVPVNDLTVDIEPVQDLHGFSNPWPAGGGKNLLEPAAINAISDAGITVTRTDTTLNGYAATQVNVSGTAASWGWGLYQIGIRSIAQPSTSYRLTFVANAQYSFTWKIAATNSQHSLTDNKTLTCESIGGGLYKYSSEFTTYSSDNDGWNYTDQIILVRPNPSTLSPVTVTIINDFCLTLQSDSAEWQPYSNICPINGWIGANVTKTGKNLYHAADVNLSTTPTVSVANGEISLSGTPTSRFDYSPYHGSTGIQSNISLPAGTYTVSVSGLVSGMEYVIGSNGSEAGYYSFSSDGSRTITLTKYGTLGYDVLRVSANTTVNTVVKIQIEHGSSASSFEPYSETAYPISWQTEAGIVYGGTLDVTTGLLTVSRALVSSTWGDLTKTNVGTTDKATIRLEEQADGDTSVRGMSISNITTFKNNTTDVIHYQIAQTGNSVTFYLPTGTSSSQVVQLCYYLATPVTYQMTPYEVKVLTDTNNIFADTGNVSVTYSLDTSANAPAIDWTNTLTYTFASGELSTVPTGWSQSIPSGSDPIYVTQAVARSTGTTDTIPYTEWTSPVLMAQSGQGSEATSSTLDGLVKRLNESYSTSQEVSTSIQVLQGEITTLLTDSYVENTEFQTYQRDVLNTIRSTAMDVVESYGYNERIDTLDSVTGALTHQLDSVNGEIRRGIITDIETGEKVIGIVIAEKIEIDDSQPTEDHDGITYYPLAAGQTVGIYTSTGWQFWINGAKRGWFDANDGMLHVVNQVTEGTSRIGRSPTVQRPNDSVWEVSTTSGYGLRYLG